MTLALASASLLLSAQAAFSLPVAVSGQAAQQPPERRKSLLPTTTIHQVESRILGNTRRVWVCLPRSYEAEPKRRFKVLYMHDGQNVFDGATSYIPNAEWRADETADSLAGAGLVEPLILVGIANMEVERANEYLPTRATVRGSTAGGKADSYGRFIVEELMPWVNRTWRTQTGPAATGLAGSSFGGIVTAHLGMTRPDVFGRLAIVSPSFWWDDQVMLKRMKERAGRWPVRAWMDMGTAEGPGATVLAREFAKIMESKGMRRGRDFVYVEEEGAEHNEPAWARRFGEMLMFLFPARR